MPEAWCRAVGWCCHRAADVGLARAASRVFWLDEGYDAWAWFPDKLVYRSLPILCSESCRLSVSRQRSYQRFRLGIGARLLPGRMV
jgi:hypothetical protein